MTCAKIVAGDEQSCHFRTHYNTPSTEMENLFRDLFRDQVVVVTGARGFIGSHVADQLVQSGAHVRALTRSLQAPRGKFAAALEWFEGDVTEIETLRKPFADARYIFHVAGDYRFWARDPQTIYRSNVAGTENVLQLAGTVGAEKIVVTSTQGVLEPGTLENPGGETRRISAVHGPYKSSKLAAHDVVQKHLAQGAPIVSVLPGAPIGENDLRPTPTGAVIVRFLKGQLPMLAQTGLSFVDVGDVARGHLLALAHGKTGQDYLLAGRNLWLQEFLQLLAPYAKHPVPTRYAPVWLSRIAAFGSESWHRLIRSDADPFITMESVRMSERPYFFSSAKAMRELGYTLSPLENAVERAVRDFRHRGVL
ncbi:MAG TPA: NAD-dependent epimerase/dehydratase family protein [Chthoniobacterales bacterium]|jgi:dihydroflavonol-4-reductase